MRWIAPLNLMLDYRIKRIENLVLQCNGEPNFLAARFDPPTPARALVEPGNSISVQFLLVKSRNKKVTSLAVNGNAVRRSELDSPTITNRGEGFMSQPPDTKGLEGDERKPNYKSCQENAQVWGLYLKEANLEDQELTAIWNNGLDSLLIFAGLFASIITSFLIESSGGLKEDPQERLLQDIRSILINEPVSPTSNFQPDPSSLHVNALWYCSFTLTLISALSGVLAKGWIAYYNPASRRERASDACERHLRATRAQLWKLGPVINIIPLLIQLSLILFFVGLIIQIWDNDVRIWVITFPFQTPITGILEGSLQARRSRRKPRATNLPQLQRWSSWKNSITSFINAGLAKPKQTEMEAHILAWTIANSTEDQTVDEAIMAIGSAKPNEDLRRKKLENALIALLQLEQPLFIDMNTSGLAESGQLDQPFLYLLHDGQPLHRWDDFKPFLQPLVFSLRIHILVSSKQDDHMESWEQTKAKLHQMAKNGWMPYVWEVMLLAALRGFLHGGEMVHRSCGILIADFLSTGKHGETQVDNETPYYCAARMLVKELTEL
ncbi:7880_t:CDS:2, partial [Acaulospora colombiana]